MKLIQKIKTGKKTKAKDYTINPALQGKYDNQPLFQDKLKQTADVLKTAGIPKF